MNQERGKKLENPTDLIAEMEELIANIQKQIDPIVNIKELITNIEELIDNTKKLIENIKNPRVKVELILQDCPDIKTKEYLNKTAFLFNTQVPGAVHGATEIKTLDKECRLIVSVDEAHFKGFEKYIKEKDKDIICLLAFEE